MVLRDREGRDVARAVTDFAGYALFDGLALGRWQVEAGGWGGGHLSPLVELSRARPDDHARILIAPQP